MGGWRAYKDLNDAARLARDPAMRTSVGREGLDHAAASSAQMGCFETEWPATNANLEALTRSGAWIDRVHERMPPDSIVLDMDGSESPTHGQQECAVWNGRFGRACHRPLFLFNQFGRPGALPPAAREYP